MKSSVYVLLLIVSLTACKEENKTAGTSQKLVMLTDESFFPLINAERKVFEYIYKDTGISSLILPESEAIEKFVYQKAEMAVVSRYLTPMETQFLKQHKIYPDSYKIASDGLALIVHKERKDSSLSAAQLKAIFSGEIFQWKQLGSEGDSIVIAFDQNNSSNLQQAHKQFPLNTGKATIFAAGSGVKVIEYVKSNKDAIGIISVSWLSDDPASNKYLQYINVLSIDGFMPWQDDLATGKYPLKRDIILLNRHKSGLGTAFASFILSPDGQRIVLKAGLLPAKMPGREVIFN